MTAHILFGASNQTTRVLDLWATQTDTASNTVSGAVDLGVAIRQGFDPVRIGAVSLFIGGNAAGLPQLWSTDGTAAGTRASQLLAVSGQALTVNAMQAFRGKAVIAAENPVDHTSSLWITDATRGGTTMLASGLTASGFQVVDGTLYFTGAQDPFNVARERLFRSDGTMAGTTAISPAGTIVAPDALVALANGRVLFENSRDSDGNLASTLWVTDGSVAGTRQLAVPNLQPDSGRNGFVSVDGLGLFGFAVGADGGSALWTSDGTAGGTRQIVVAGGDTVLTAVGSLTPFGGKVLFAASDAGGRSGLWISDGTDAGTRLLGLYAGIGSLTAFGGKVGFSAIDAGRPALWITDGTASGTHEVLAAGAAATGLDPQGLFPYFDRLGFTGADAGGHHGLWLSDGTDGGTGEVAVPAASTMLTDTTALAGSGNLVLLDGVTPYYAVDGDTVRGGAGQDVVVDPSGAILVGGGVGPLTFVGGTGFSTVTGGAGPLTVFGGGGGGIYAGGFDAAGSGGNVLIAGGGNTTLTGGGSLDRLFGASGGNTSMAAAHGRETLVGGGGDTVFQAGVEQAAVIFTGDGAATVLGGNAGGDTIVGGAGTLRLGARGGEAVFAGSGAATVTGSSNGPDSIIGGTGALVVSGQGSNMIVVGGAGPASIDTGNGYGLIFQGGGDMSIAARGPLQVIAGSGSASIAVGSGGILLDVVRGAAGGLDVIGGFRPQTDRIDLFGFTAPDLHSHVTDGSVTLSLSDGTRITLLGITDPGHALALI
jgi:ELWxxDGT repeat protein